MKHPFLDQSRLGKTQPMNFFGALSLTWGAWLLVGGLPFFGLVAYLYAQDPESAEKLSRGGSFADLPVPELLAFSLMMSQFIFGWVGLWVSTKFILKRSFRSLITAARRVRWGRMLLGFSVWTGVIGLFFYGVSLKEPGLVQFNPDWDRFWMYLPAILFWVPLQSAFEEVAFRGQMLQTSYFRSGFRPFVPLFTTSALFAVFHSFNPEVETYGWWTMMGLYFVTGMALGIFTILDNGLELAIGIHVGNNLFAFLLLSYPDGTLQLPTLFQLDSFSPTLDLLSVLAASLVLFVILFGRDPGVLRKITAKGDLPKSETDQE